MICYENASTRYCKVMIQFICIYVMGPSLHPKTSCSSHQQAPGRTHTMNPNCEWLESLRLLFPFLMAKFVLLLSKYVQLPLVSHSSGHIFSGWTIWYLPSHVSQWASRNSPIPGFDTTDPGAGTDFQRCIWGRLVEPLSKRDAYQAYQWSASCWKVAHPTRSHYGAQSFP